MLASPGQTWGGGGGRLKLGQNQTGIDEEEERMEVWLRKSEWEESGRPQQQQVFLLYLKCCLQGTRSAFAASQRHRVARAGN